MQVFQQAQRRVVQALFLLLGLLIVPILQAQSLSATQPTAEVFFDTQTATSTVGGESSIPLMLNTNGWEIDALQVRWEMQGVTLADVRLELAPNVPFTVFNAEVTPGTGSAYFLPTSPQTPFSSSSPTVLATLYFTPQGSGALAFRYDRENTLIAAHDTSENIANIHADGVLAINGVLQMEEAEALPEPVVNTSTSENFVEETVLATGSGNSLMTSPAFLLIVGALLVVLIATGLLLWWKRRTGVVATENTLIASPAQFTGTAQVSVAPASQSSTLGTGLSVISGAQSTDTGPQPSQTPQGS